MNRKQAQNLPYAGFGQVSHRALSTLRLILAVSGAFVAHESSGLPNSSNQFSQSQSLTIKLEIFMV